MKTNFEKLENGEIKMTIFLENKEFEKFHEKGFKKIQAEAEIDGFRKGNAPEELIIKKYGEMAIIQEMADIVINETYFTSIIKENESKKDDEKIFPISQPKISISKIGKGSDFEYTATFPILPKIDLPDYKSIAKKEGKNILEKEIEEAKKKNQKTNEENIFEVSNEEVDEVLLNLQKARTPNTHIHEDGTIHHESHEESENSNDKKEEIKIENLPPLDDAFAQSFGENFKTLDDLKTKIKENLKLEKTSKIIDKKRIAILEKIISETKIKLPEILVEDELERMKVQMKADIQKFGSTWEDYLSHLNKKEEDLKIEWKDTAEKRILSQLILNEIAKKEKIEVKKEEIEAEVLKIITAHPEAEENHVQNYVIQFISNDKVMKLLEEMK